MAFAGRYGKQPINVALSLPVSDLRRFSLAVADLMKEEADQLKTDA